MLHPLHRLTDTVVAAMLFVAVLLLLLATTNIGFTRDEGFYFHAASLYVGWFEDLWANLLIGDTAASFTRENIDRHWSYNPEHPVVMKGLFALSHKLFHDLLGWMTPSTAWRFPAMVFAAALISGVYLFATELGGRLAGLVAAACLLFQPRFFFHAHLACFDVPITALWFWLVYAYWRSLGEEKRGWALATGILFGIALSVKLNAFFLPIVLVGHWLLTNWGRFRLQRSSDDAPYLELPAIPKAFWAMLIAGPLLFYALWPRHWFDTFERVRWYMNFHLQHEHYLVNYFGQNLQIPPFPVSFPWVMTLVTVPVTILVASLIGAVLYFQRSGQLQRFKALGAALKARRWPKQCDKSDPRGTGLLICINIIFPILLISMPNTPIFGGTKHWMPAMPFLAMLAGFGVAQLARSCRAQMVELWPQKARPMKSALPVLLALCVVGPAAYATAHNHPYGTAYYNELIGGYRGAADREMMRKYWGHASRDALPWLNENASEGSRVWVHNMVNTAWRTYQAEGLARGDLRSTSLAASEFGIYHQQKAFMFLRLPLWEEYGTMAPVEVIAIDGVPLISIYARPDQDGFKHPDVWR